MKENVTHAVSLNPVIAINRQDVIGRSIRTKKDQAAAVDGTVIPKVIHVLQKKDGNIAVVVEAGTRHAASEKIMMIAAHQVAGMVDGSVIPKAIRVHPKKDGNIVAVVEAATHHEVIAKTMMIAAHQVAAMVDGSVILKVIHVLPKKDGNIAVVVEVVTRHEVIAKITMMIVSPIVHQVQVKVVAGMVIPKVIHAPPKKDGNIAVVHAAVAMEGVVVLKVADMAAGLVTLKVTPKQRVNADVDSSSAFSRKSRDNVSGLCR